MKPNFLEAAQVLRIHRDQAERYGGTPAIRDIRLLLSIMAVPRTRAGDQYAHTDLFEIAAAYLLQVVRKRPFEDNDRRTAAVAAIVFLELNSIDMQSTNDELAALVTAVAKGKASKSAVAEFFRAHARA